ncbi:glycosyltransferase [Tundrisphaera lichenicola]|uniref:glycosyltransferase n=1 Tax=Tundrisphaera lichenicola TaxID=2029860 RepID=UPI003EBDD1E0
MMASISRRDPSPIRGGSDRPYAFLVSTTGCARGIRNTLGSAAYSYFFVLEALAPVLEKLGTWRLLDHPESSLPFAAARAEAEGYQPIHLALHPPQDVYLTPALPNVIFPFWEFPDLPDRDFGHDTRQNWVRVCSRADLILTACHFTADSFRRAGVSCPIGIVPVPLRPDHFEIPAWDPDHTWTLTCRNEVWEGTREAKPVEQAADSPSEVEQTGEEPEPITSEPRPGLKRRAFLVARGIFRKVYPWLGTRTLERIARTRHYLLMSMGRSPYTMEPLPGPKPGLGRLAYAMARDGYRRFFKRWLSHEALDTITQAKVRALKMIGREPVMAPDPLLPSTEVTLGGLVFASIFNLGDRRKNHIDLLSAYLLAFQDREDVTLVIKLATNPTREHHEINILRHMYFSLGILHKCRVVVITDFLTDVQMADLMRVTTFYVNTSKAEGACLPLQQSLAAGRPSIAPGHTAMADFMDEKVGFVIRTHPEPTYWPHDPEMRTETSWHRMVWSDLHDHLLAAASMIEEAPEEYRAMAETARSRMADYASREVVADALREALGQLPRIETGRFAWAS